MTLGAVDGSVEGQSWSMMSMAAIGAKLDTLSVNTQSRLERIETLIGLNGAPRPGKRPLRGSLQRRKAA